jgi:hypothetical protein
MNSLEIFFQNCDDAVADNNKYNLKNKFNKELINLIKNLNNDIISNIPSLLIEISIILTINSDYYSNNSHNLEVAKGNKMFILNYL